MGIPSAILKAAVAKLQGDAALTAILGAGKVFNNVPQDADSANLMPYLVVRVQPTVPFNDKGRNGWTVELAVDAYSDEHGDRQALEILHRVRLVFDGPRLTLDTGRVVCSTFQTANVVDGDGQYRTGSASFVLLCEET